MRYSQALLLPIALAAAQDLGDIGNAITSVGGDIASAAESIGSQVHLQSPPFLIPHQHIPDH